jgi:hypothetical protein
MQVTGQALTAAGTEILLRFYFFYLQYDFLRQRF